MKRMTDINELKTLREREDHIERAPLAKPFGLKVFR